MKILFDPGRAIVGLALLVLCCVAGRQTYAQQSLEQRQPLELVFADSVVPQDRHETMLTTGGWYFRRDLLHRAQLTQKVEWGISDRLQVSTFVQVVNSSNETGTTKAGIGDFEIGVRYTWARVGTEFTHLAVAFDAGFPTGNARRGLGEGAYTVSPSMLISRELREGKWQIFSTNGAEFVVKRQRPRGSQEIPRSAFFSNSGVSLHAGRGWIIGEISLSTNQWSGGDETQLRITPAYVWRIGQRAELLFGAPLGISSSTERVGAVVKFTFELGGKPD